MNKTHTFDLEEAFEKNFNFLDDDSDDDKQIDNSTKSNSSPRSSNSTLKDENSKMI